MMVGQSELYPKSMCSFLASSTTHLEGIGIQEAAALRESLGIHTYEDLLYHFPFRYEDRTQITPIKEIKKDVYVQCKGRLSQLHPCRWGRKKGLKATFSDDTGSLSLVWFHQLKWLQRWLQPLGAYVLFGKPSRYRSRLTIIHPEMTPLLAHQQPRQFLQPVYPTTTRLTKLRLHSKGLANLVQSLLQQSKGHINEHLPAHLLSKYKLMPREEALREIHQPSNATLLHQAQRRLKFEEFFYLQLRLMRAMTRQTKQPQALVFTDFKTQTAFKAALPFALTSAQIKALKEIGEDMSSGWQMNRFLQGDVGSGKTIVAFMSMLLPIAHGCQVALMAPTTLLATQHHHTLSAYAERLGITVGLLTGATSKRERDALHEKLRDGSLQILVGTHAVIQPDVAFHRLGLVVIDEKHRFGVLQRAHLWGKSHEQAHRLIMSATPIPRTLSMTIYRHLDCSIIDEMPAGRLPIKTYHADERHRLRVFGFVRQQLAQGHQVYIVYPRIEEGTGGLKHVMDGYESICNAFTGTPIGILHGRMNAVNKQYEMRRFAKGETKIMVATTVIEVGIDVPNATLMIIEDAEQFGLSQLHQLRGRVGRGPQQSYTILMTKANLNPSAKARIQAMTSTSDGFKIAELDLKLRGPGNLDGVEQSGFWALKIVDLSKDMALVREATHVVEKLLQEDPDLTAPAHASVAKHLQHLHNNTPAWHEIS